MPQYQKTFSAAVVGLDASLIEVEVDLIGGFASLSIVGLPDKAVEEAKERITSAIKNSGAQPPLRQSKRVIINLAPAGIKKEGPFFDVPMAMGYLLATKQVTFNPSHKIFVGELALDGTIRPINGVLSIALLAAKSGVQQIFVPMQNVAEASLVKGVEIFGVKTLKDLIQHFSTESRQIGPARFNKAEVEGLFYTSEIEADFAYVQGQETAKRALEITAAGGHNILLSGPPGSGKTLLARSFAGILPPLSLSEALEVTRIFSIVGQTSSDSPVITSRQIRSPHHTSSAVSLIGGGSNPRPGEITLAHLGVLFLDELPEFQRSVLEALRQPLEDGEVVVSRAMGAVKFPAQFILVGAMNPCPCGHLTNPLKECACTASQVSRYQRKISGPLMDRFDMQIEVPQVTYKQLASEAVAESSLRIRERVINAREIQSQRLKNDSKKYTNANLSNLDIKKYCRVDAEAQSLLKNAVSQYHLSARSYYRVLRVARTIADLSNKEQISSMNIAEALRYRSNPTSVSSYETANIS